jgi:hydrogenase maturation factor
LINLSKIGKFPPNIMEKIIYPRLGRKRPEIIVGPGHGLDNAVVQLGHNQVLVISSDPLSAIPELGMKDSAWLSVHLLASDLSTCGFPPRFIVTNFSLPPQMKNEQFEEYWNAFHTECEKLGIAILGGHTGRYVGADYTVIGGGVMMTLAPENRYLAASMAKPGDHIIMTKGVAVAATGILARVFPETVKEAYGLTFFRKAQEYFYEFSVVKDALTAASVGLRDDGVTAMHDVTEGGLLGALYELSEASKVGLEVNISDIIVTKEEKLICDLFSLDPYVTLSEGTLIIAVKPSKAQKVLDALRTKGIQGKVIGRILDRDGGRWIRKNGRLKPLRKPTVDPYWKAYWKAYREGWK